MSLWGNRCFRWRLVAPVSPAGGTLALLSNPETAGLTRALVRSWLYAYIHGPLTTPTVKLWSRALDQTSRRFNLYRKTIVLGT